MEICTCPADGNARRCLYHTQADFDAAERAIGSMDHITYLGHDTERDCDVMVTVWSDGTVRLATRPGADRTDLTWSRDTDLTAERTFTAV